MSFKLQEKIADYWLNKDNGVKCLLCPHSCFLKDGQIGLCKTRKNKNGKLIALTYGYPCALHIDPVEKKPLYHFYPGSKTFSISTTGCNLNCLNCQNHSISQQKLLTAKSFISPQQIISMTKKNNCKSIAFTYTDPVVYYEYTKEIAILAKEENIKTILVSAAFIQHKALIDLLPFIDAANIDLKCFDADIYKKLCGADLDVVLDNLKTFLEHNVWLEITNLIIPEYTDKEKQIENMCNWLYNNGFEYVPLHFNRFFPANKLSHLNTTPLQKMMWAYKIANNSGLKHIYLGNISSSEYSNTRCHKCARLLIKRSGYYTQINALEKNICLHCGAKIKGRFDNLSSCAINN